MSSLRLMVQHAGKVSLKGPFKCNSCKKHPFFICLDDQGKTLRSNQSGDVTFPC